MTEPTALRSDPDARSDARLRGDRYTQLRAMLAKNAPLSLEQYLAAQQVFLLADLLAEMQDMHETLAAMTANMDEIASRAWMQPKAGIKFNKGDKA